MEEDVKKYRDRLPSATLDEQIEYLEEKLEIIQVSPYTTIYHRLSSHLYDLIM